VARDVDDAHTGAGRQRAPREPEVDRQAAPFLLLEAVRVDAREGPDERGFPVVDVPGGADDVFLRLRSAATWFRPGTGSTGIPLD